MIQQKLREGETGYLTFNHAGDRGSADYRLLNVKAGDKAALVGRYTFEVGHTCFQSSIDTATFSSFTILSYIYVLIL